MVNATCQMICYVNKLISYNGHDQEYIGNYTTRAYNSATIIGATVAGTIYIGQQLLRGSGKSTLLPRAFSVLKWGMITLSVASQIVAFIDQQTGFFHGAPPTYVYPIFYLGNDMLQCGLQC